MNLKQTFHFIFPLLAYQHIYQLEEYRPSRFLNWWLHHPLTRQTSSKKPLIITPKVRSSLIISCLLLTTLLFFSFFNFILLPFAFCLIIFPFPLLFAVTYLRYPIDEILDRQFTIYQTRNRIASHPHLVTIGVTGSYGKTSTKDFLYEILSHHQFTRRGGQTLKTPESYNTLFGIAKVVKLELHKKLYCFICEMGAYVRGEIKELTKMTPPDYAILTAIGSQHLERFKSLENTTLAKFELVDAVKPENALVNLDNQYISDHLKLPQYSSVKTYSFVNKTADFFVKSYHLRPTGSDLEVTHKGTNYNFKTKLFGTSNLENLVAAIGMAFILGLDYEEIKSAVSQIEPSPHRLELTKIGNATLIDNAYSSNEVGFTKIISDLKDLPGKKALITPGIIELGSHTAAIHKKIGSLAAEVFDRIILVGHSERTENLSRGIAGKTKIDYLENNSSVWPTIDSLAKTHDWILLENDLPDNF